MNIFGYLYEADFHCPQHTEERFRPLAWIVEPPVDRESLEPAYVRDREGNEVRPVLDTDEFDSVPTCPECLQDFLDGKIKEIPPVNANVVTLREPEPITPVIFRKWRPRPMFDEPGGDIIAMFPTLPGTLDPYTCESYQHIGQHGSAHLDIISFTVPATPEEYADLKRELESAPYGYKFKVYQRLQASFPEERRAELKRMKG